MRISDLVFSDEARARLERELSGDRHGPDTARRVIREKIIIEGLEKARLIPGDESENLYGREIGWTDGRKFYVLFTMVEDRALVQSVLVMQDLP